MQRLFYPPIRAAPIQSASCNGPPAPPNFNVGHCDARYRAKAGRGLCADWSDWPAACRSRASPPRNASLTNIEFGGCGGGVGILTPLK